MLAWVLSLGVFASELDALELLCRSFDASPSRAQLLTAQRTPSAGLIALARDITRPAWVRARAVRLLPALDDGADALESLARTAPDTVVRRALASAFARAYANAPERAFAYLRPALSDADPSVRRHAAAALARFPMSAPLLARRLDEELDPSVRDALVLSLWREHQAFGADRDEALMPQRATTP